MNQSIDTLISVMNEDLLRVQKVLERAKKKDSSNSKTKSDALVYIEKAEKVIQQAETGKIHLSEEQVDRIKDTLKKIMQLFKVI